MTLTSDITKWPCAKGDQLTESQCVGPHFIPTLLLLILKQDSWSSRHSKSPIPLVLELYARRGGAETGCLFGMLGSQIVGPAPFGFVHSIRPMGVAPAAILAWARSCSQRFWRALGRASHHAEAVRTAWGHGEGPPVFHTRWGRRSRGSHCFGSRVGSARWGRASSSIGVGAFTLATVWGSVGQGFAPGVQSIALELYAWCGGAETGRLFRHEHAEAADLGACAAPARAITHLTLGAISHHTHYITVVWWENNTVQVCGCWLHDE